MLFASLLCLDVTWREPARHQRARDVMCVCVVLSVCVCVQDTPLSAVCCCSGALLFSLSNAMRVLNGRNSTARRLFAMRRLSSAAAAAAKTLKLFHSAHTQHTHQHTRAHTHTLVCCICQCIKTLEYSKSCWFLPLLFLVFSIASRRLRGVYVMFGFAACLCCSYFACWQKWHLLLLLFSLCFLALSSALSTVDDGKHA